MQGAHRCGRSRHAISGGGPGRRALLPPLTLESPSRLRLGVGYFELQFNKKEVNAQFYGYLNNSLPETEELLVAQFNVKKGANKLTRPINYGIKPISGSLQAQAVDYSKSQWNGTAFVDKN